MTRPITANNARKLLRAWHRGKCRELGADSRLSMNQARGEDGDPTNAVAPWDFWDGDDEEIRSAISSYRVGAWLHVSFYSASDIHPDADAGELEDTVPVRVTPDGTIEEG